ncbi:MAG TPA: Rieske (2Fe-2S) protein [Mycobacteriales bacterium]|jgi:nitrite reductase/ring-hydroxylating ferredoxin subunit/uncharacterized membrane protein|nr:Rieske (2Fe-2S) protein [Mycobacteriales bacterium]
MAGSIAERMVDRVEHAHQLDGAVGLVRSAWSTVLKAPKVRDLLSGRSIGHPLHPIAVQVAAGLLASSTVLDLVGDQDGEAAGTLLTLGLVAAVPTAAAGWADWIDTEDAESRVGLVHASANALAIAAYLLSWRQRRRGRSGRAAGLTGAATMAVGGYLGGHLAFAQGVGVDTTAFQAVPTDWTVVGPAADVTAALHQVRVNGLPVLLTRVDGQIVALADRCTHRGAPLSDGTRDETGCVVCPWHNSRFDLRTGQVERGPATRPQPAFEVRERDGNVEIRRQEVRALRVNPV